jgi:3-hydroxyisobutyrate dehydrogenase-like beta-hydroxyacid dehydrogenase
MSADAPVPATRWLIVGHGSVGSALVRRFVRAGIAPRVFDPAPRVPVAGAEFLASLIGVAPFENVVSCVAPSAALNVVETVRPVIGPQTLFLDWNTLPPDTKQQIAAAMPPGVVVDVALMDTLDQEAERPSLAVSGPQAARAAEVLRRLGFAVDDVGATCGDAARLKLSRSLFMKGLEALVIEFRAAIAPLAGREVVLSSIERNVGPQFMAFAEMLIETDRLHAARRANELAEAVSIFGSPDQLLTVARAAVEVLRSAADAWAAPNAPPAGAGADAFAAYLSGTPGEGNVRAAR